MTQTPSDSLLRKILSESRTFACVGVSANEIRPSYFVVRYLSYRNYRVVPVNPVIAGQKLFGEVVYRDLASIPEDIQIDVVDIFRRSEAVPAIVDEALAHLPGLKTIWMQVGVSHKAAAQKAEDAGVQVIQNRCPKIEYQRLFGELRKAGINTGIISSRL